MSDVPLVGVVVVNFNGRDLTLRCLERLHELTWPAERIRVVLVDNASSDGTVDAVRQQWADVDIVEAGSNLGFGGACNRGFERLSDAKYIALINNDAVPDRGWLEPLVDALERDPHAGAATPKVLLSGRWHELHLVAEGTRVDTDPRELGVQVAQVCVGGRDVTSRVEHADGFWAPETSSEGLHHFRWTQRTARLLVPASGATDRVTIEVGVPGGDRRLSIRSGPTSVDASVSGVVRVEVDPRAEGERVINNAGALIRADGTIVDRGYHEVDRGQYDTPEELDAWSGAAVLLRKAFLDDVGGFDERLFLYYEDADLSWRGHARGWKYRYVPSSVVEHDHSATTKAMPALVEHLSARNRLVVVTKLAPRRAAIRAWLDYAGDVIDAIEFDLLRRAARGERPVPQHVAGLLRVGLGAVRLLPGALAFRASQRRTRTR